MKITCRSCGRSEKTDRDLFVKIIGGALPVGGFWAWTAYFFAGTGFALPIVLAMIAGGTALLVFKDEIVQWISNMGYACVGCGKTDWEV